MSNYSTLKGHIDNAIYQNDTQDISGTDMNSILKEIVDSFGGGYLYMGVATPSTDPSTPDQNVFYIAGTEGTYTNFGGITVANEVAVLKYNGAWSKQNTGIPFVSVSQNSQTGHTDINIGSDSYPVASVEEVSQLGQEINKTANDVCIRGTLEITFSESENYFRVNVTGDKTLMARGKFVAFASLDGPVSITSENYYIIYVDLADDNEIKVVTFSNFLQVATNVVIGQFYFNTPIDFEPANILYSAFSAVTINGVSQYAPGSLVNVVNGFQTLINRTANDVTLIGKLTFKTESDGLHLSLSGVPLGSGATLLSRGKYICFPQTQNLVVSSDNYYIVYIDLTDDNKIKVIAHNNFNQVDTNVVIAQFHYSGLSSVFSEEEIGYSAASVIEIDGVILSRVRSELKYAEIGDSITYLADNKYETSYDDIGTELTGYKGHGYGRYLAEAMGVPYANHYPQGANGRTFSEYYKEWAIDNHWSFPENIDIWTIFLGTNDWGKGASDLAFKQELGTIDDYKNDTWTLQNATTYGAMRKIVDKIRSLSTNGKVPKIIFITPMQRGAFVYGQDQATAESVFVPSAIKRNSTGAYEYVLNEVSDKRAAAFTLKDVVDAVKEVCDYESFECVDWFNNSIFDKSFLNMAQTFANVGWSISTPFGTVNIDGMRDNLHPSENGRIYKVMGKRLIGKVGADFYDR